MATATAPDDALPQAERAYRDGQFYEAEVLYHQLLGDLPQDSHLFLEALRGRALALHGLGRFHDAEQQLRRILLACIHEPEGERAVDALGHLAAAVCEQERFIEAEALARDAVRRGESALGQRHEATLLALLSLGRVLAHTAPAESEPWIRETREVIARALGRSHPVTWSAQHLLMATLRALGRWDEAEQAADGLIVMRERHQGAGHPYALQARCDLALILHAAGKRLEASAAADDVVDVSVRALGPQHPVTARIRQDHATITGR
ncbi:tetratricopeptide repeat protein [Streptomyces sp. NPDC050988]|uniref:tetratricopeptide repeat protein n=1 Tax=Streptomyces sp. NPDC050988 TaxID=3365637 RepID=UPI0037885788